jgi:hypothetical protein
VSELFLVSLRLKRKPKNIKKRYKILILVLTAIFLLPAGAMLVLSIDNVQTALTRYVTEKLSVQLGTRVSIGYVNIRFFNRVNLKDVYVEDASADTLLHVKDFTAGLTGFSRSQRKISIGRLNFKDAAIRIKQDSSRVLNLQFILDALAAPDTTKRKWTFSISGLELQNASLRYETAFRAEKEKGINFRDVDLSGLDLLATRIRFEKDSVSFRIRNLNFKEKSGFELVQLTSDNRIGPGIISLQNILLKTPLSDLRLEHLEFLFDDKRAFRSFLTEVRLDASFNPSDLHFQDLGYVAPQLNGFYEKIGFSGLFRGTVSNFKAEQLAINMSPRTSIKANMNLIGLPDIRETFIFLDLISLQTNSGDIENLRIPGTEVKQINLPDPLKNLGSLSYEGKFTGFIDDFVAYGNLSSSLGYVFTDLLIRPGTNNQIQYEGRVKTEDFNLGKLLDAKEIGDITLNAQVQGSLAGDTDPEASLEGVIESFEVLDYTYQQIKLSGELSGKKFDGSVSVTDPNVSFQFLGRVDFSDSIPNFDFSAYANNTKLYYLNLDRSDPENATSFLVTANFSGNTPDNMDGEIRLLNLDYTRNGKSLHIDNLILRAGNEEGMRKISLSSNFMDGEVVGNYEFATLPNSINYLISVFLPAYSLNGRLEEYRSKNNFDYFFKLKDTEQITSFFLPWLSISPDASFSGLYYPENLDISLSGHADEIRIANNHFKQFSLSSSTSDSLFRLYSLSKEALLFNGYLLENFELNSTALSDSVGFDINWDNKDIVRNSGRFRAFINFEKPGDRSQPIIDIQISPSKIIIADSVWTVSRSSVRVDSTAISVGDFMFSSKSQLLNLYGKISHDPYDSLYLVVDNIDLEQFNLRARTKKFDITGIIDGRMNLSSVYAVPYVGADIKIADLFVNREPLGNLTINTSWNSRQRSLAISAFADRQDDRLISLSGSLIPETKELQMDVKLNKINVRIFDGFLDVVFRDIRGIANGEATVRGTLDKPLINGSIALQKASLMVDYLKTRYSFTHTIQVRNNNILFDQLVLTDPGNNTATLNGAIRTTYFRDILLDLSINARNFLSLNTSESDNELFYGRVFSTGAIKISGSPKNILMDISARTEQNSEFYIPLSATSEVGEFNFLTFTGSESVGDDSQRSYEVDLSGIQLNFDLQVTPDAEIQIIFDSKIGDIIRGRGTGNLKMEINTQGSFNMFGEYIIDQGDYLFTLQNVINKRFEVEQGGRINWNGNPYDANVDLLAIYRVRAPLSGLFLEDSEQFTRRVPVECQIQLRNKLMSPDMSFNIDIPTADADTRMKFQGILNTEEKINRQFLSLLIINNFLPEQDFFAGSNPGNTFGMGATTAGMTTASEFFSNQLSNWLSQISKEIDIGVNYRPGDEVSPEELEVALSTQVFNDRVRINGNVDMSGRQTNTSNIVGEFDIDIKLNRSGKFRLKAFTRANDNLRYQISPYTQGVGLFYREEYDTFEELMQKYWRLITFRRDDEDS